MRFEVADSGDAAVFYPDVALVAGHPRTVNYHSPSDEHIKFSHVQSPKSEVRTVRMRGAGGFDVRLARPLF
jgi:hypothetical protein